MGSCPMGGPRRTAHDRSRAPRAGPPSKTAFGGTNHHHGPCEPSLRSFRTGLRRGGAKIPEIRKHPPEHGPKTGLKTASTLSAVEPVSAPPKRKLENRHQRPEPETRPARAEMPEIADQRLGHPSLTCGNVGDSPPPGNKPTSAWRKELIVNSRVEAMNFVAQPK